MVSFDEDTFTLVIEPGETRDIALARIRRDISAQRRELRRRLDKLTDIELALRTGAFKTVGPDDAK